MVSFLTLCMDGESKAETAADESDGGGAKVAEDPMDICVNKENSVLNDDNRYLIVLAQIHHKFIINISYII